MDNNTFTRIVECRLVAPQEDIIKHFRESYGVTPGTFQVIYENVLGVMFGDEKACALFIGYLVQKGYKQVTPTKFRKEKRVGSFYYQKFFN